MGTNVSEILIEIHIFSFKKMHLKLSSAKTRSLCLGLNVFTKQRKNILMTGRTNSDSLTLTLLFTQISYSTSTDVFARSQPESNVDFIGISPQWFEIIILYSMFWSPICRIIASCHRLYSTELHISRAPRSDFEGQTLHLQRTYRTKSP